jgi:hypothetical protein
LLVRDKPSRVHFLQIVGTKSEHEMQPFITHCAANMQKNMIQVPEKGTYKWQLFDYWSGEYRQTHAGHNAYIALNFAGALDACKSKFQALVQHHRAKASDAATGARHMRAIERLENTMSGAAVAYESGFHRH